MSGGVPSPCTDVCRMNEARGVCEGCLRTLDEIAAWGRLDDAGKRALWVQLDLRRAALPPLVRADTVGDGDPP